MANNWNPNAPALLGLEWPLTTSMVENIQQPAPFAQRLRSTVAETITNLQLRMSMNGSDTRSLLTVVDVMPAGSELPGPVLSVDYAPNADGAIGTWLTDAGGATNLWSFIDDPVVYPPSATDFIKTNAYSGAEFEVASAGFGAGRRVVRVRIAAVIGAQVNWKQFQFRLRHVPSGGLYHPPASNLWGSGYGTLVNVDCGEINPFTELPWTPADIQGFDSGVWRIRVESPGTAPAYSNVASLALRVEYVAVENRVAVASWRRPTTGAVSDITTAALIRLPTGAASWPKPSSGDFTFLWRRAYDLLLNSSGAAQANDVQWRIARADVAGADVASPVPGMTGLRIPINSLGLVSGAAVAYPGQAAVLVLNHAGGASDDSQPYRVSVLIGTTGEQIAQRIAPGANASYIDVRVIASPPDSAAGTLTATVHRVSDGLQMGGSAAWDADVVRSMPEITPGTPYRLLEGHLSAGASLISGTQYEVRFTVTGPGTWIFPMPHADFGATATFGGTTQSARDGGGVLPSDELSAVLLQQPDPPTNVTAAAVEIPAPGDGCLCSVAAIEVIRLAWTATALGGTFARYEIERQDGDADAPWVAVATAATEATEAWLNGETARGVPVRYRIRVTNTTQAFSPWVETDWVVASAKGCEVIFASDARPELTVAYDRDPEIGRASCRERVLCVV